MKVINLKPEIEAKICEDFQDRSQTRDSILQKYKISKTKLKRILIDNNINQRFRYRKYFFNEHFLNEIDTPEKAQILGFLYADGTIGNSRVSAGLKFTDKQYLLDILSKFEAPKGLLRLYPSSSHVGPLGNIITSQDQYRFRLSSRILYNDCLKHGLIPRKSWANIGIPYKSFLSKKLIKYFILGVFEGDGWTGISNKNKYSIGWCGSFKMMSDIRDVIFDELGVKLPAISKYKSCCQISYTSKNALISIINWLYSENYFHMSRKFNRMQYILNATQYNIQENK